MILHIKNIYICISWYFFIMLIWIALINKLETFFLCFVSLVIHEAGHIIMIKILKEKINIFYVLPFGFCCKLKNQNKVSDKKMLKILLAGPAVSIITAGIFILWTKDFSIVNFIIGIFNLMPIGELDGGRVVKIIEKR